MAMSAKRWREITTSQFPWERDALAFVRERLPDWGCWLAWSNFEFIAEDGSINEVDLLVLSPEGFFLVEIKSRPGRLFGDAGAWTWQHEGRLATMDNPVIAANRKAKKLRSLLQRQRICRKKGTLPYIEALVFCSAPELQFELKGTAAYRVCLRDAQGPAGQATRPGIIEALSNRRCPGLEPTARNSMDRGDAPTARMISQAMEQAGIRPSQRHRRVGDYALQELIDEGPGYQDWLAAHVQLADARRRIRLYLLRTGASEDERRTIERAALREFQILETLQHRGILRIHGFTEHELGPALIFEHDSGSMRLDHFVAQRGGTLNQLTRVSLMRQIAEIVRFAHEKRAVHRALSPRSILVTDPDNARPQVKVFNWQVGYRTGASTFGGAPGVTATSHVDRLVEDAATAYMAPEALCEAAAAGEHLDVFSLGAIAYLLFSGVAPAASGLELSNKLRESQGLAISAVLNGADGNLQDLVQFSTHPDVTSRLESAADFLDLLDGVEKAQIDSDQDAMDDPTRAQQGDRLPGNLTVLRRLGEGACSVALLVQRDGSDYILKAASDPEHNDRIAGEAQILDKLRQQHIVEYCAEVNIGDRSAFLMRPVYVDKDRKRIETLGQRLRKEGRLHVELLQRFGEDLLSTVDFLAEQGIPHRDIKPDNLAVGQVGRGDRLHLILFDFSLSRTPPENIRAGTRGYLDPMLPLRQPKPPRWDLHAERYAAAVTLYELATGTLPAWGDGTSDPSHLRCEITIDADLFDADLREGLAVFFARALRRNPAERFDNAEDMLREWRRCFEGAPASAAIAEEQAAPDLRERLSGRTFDTPIPELGLGTRATNALDRADVLSVRDLLVTPLSRLMRLRGVGTKTRREISDAVRVLREHLGSPQSQVPDVTPHDKDEPATEEGDVARFSIDQLARRASRAASKEGDTGRRTLELILGLDPEHTALWPSQADVAKLAGVTRARVGQLLGKFQQRWDRDSGLSALRADLSELIRSDTSGGVMTVEELREAVLAARGSVEAEPQRTRLAAAVTRAAIEVERTKAEPRFIVRRSGERVLVVVDNKLAEYAIRLGKAADALACEDPLAAPARVIRRLRDVTAPAGSKPLAENRLIRLAAAASGQAALSSRLELYERGMGALRALKLSHGALVGVPELTSEQIHARVKSRYPEAAPLPGRPMLDALLKEAGSDLAWDGAARSGAGRYVSPAREALSVTTGSSPLGRLPTSPGPREPGKITLEEATARQFEERLGRALRDGSFMALLVEPRFYDEARRTLCTRYPIKLVDLEDLFICALREAAELARIDWSLVLKTDARPREGDWDKLMLLVKRAVPQVEAALARADRTVLVVYAGMLGRYEQLDLLERLRDRIGRPGGPPGLWLLIPGDGQALLDGVPIPLLSPSQKVRVPVSWLRNEHRGR